MLKRRTFYEGADELITISKRFRSAYTNKDSLDEQRRNQELNYTSIRGIEILRTLALSIRTEQDYGEIPKPTEPVGVINSKASESDIESALKHYCPPFNTQIGFTDLTLRDALNKIAHINPGQTSFYADESTHDIILTGLNQKRTHTWIAIISLIELCRVIKSIPDYKYEVS